MCFHVNKLDIPFAHWFFFPGVSHSAAVPYVLGYPFLNETILNETYMVPRQYFDYDDRNISDFMMEMWSNFAIYGFVWHCLTPVVVKGYIEKFDFSINDNWI